MPDTRTTSFSYLLAPTSVVESSTAAGGGSVTRTTTTTYLADGRLDTTSTVTSGLGGSVAVPMTKTTYSPTTGAVTKVATLTGVGGSETATLLSGYDAWGRPTTATNTFGEVTTTTYVAAGSGAGQVAMVSDAKGTTTYGYGVDANGAEDRRGAPTSVTVSGIGTFTAAYDADGAMVTQVMPGGVRQSTVYDTAGEPVGLTYAGDVTTGAGTVETGAWLAWSQVNDITGRVRQEWTPLGAGFTTDTDGGAAFDRGYVYDRLERLVMVQDRTADPGVLPISGSDPASLSAACTTRTYTFDANSNRTHARSYPAGAAGVCQSGTGATTRSWSYDSADRTTSTGYGYDAFGRVTTLPAVDNPGGAGSGVVSLGYYDTDAARSISSGGKTTTYTLDPGGRRLVATTTPVAGGAATSRLVRHYGDGGDNPAWVQEETSNTTTRYTASLGGDLGAQAVTVGGGAPVVSLTLSNLHGDVVATTVLPVSGNATGIEAWSDYLEYGQARTPSATTAVGGQSGYGWLGAKERATDTSGLVLMGARLYNNITGRFTSMDPVPGGSPSAYAYPTDPINGFDLDGQRWRKPRWVTWKNAAKVAGGLALGACIFLSAGACCILPVDRLWRPVAAPPVDQLTT